MRGREILMKGIEAIRKALGIPEALVYVFKPFQRTKGLRYPVSLYILEMDKSLRKRWRTLIKKREIDIVSMKLSEKVFIARVMANGEPRFIKLVIDFFKEYKKELPLDALPMVIVPFIGPGGRELCKRQGVSYADTVGNIGIFTKNGFIVKESFRSVKSEKRRLSSLFSPKATRVLRLLLESNIVWRIKNLSIASKVSLGETYKVLQKLINEEYVKKTREGFKLLNPGRLLDEWTEYYRFTDVNKIFACYAETQSYEGLIRRIAKGAKGFSYAFTLFAGADFFAPFIRTPIIHLYLLGDIEEFIDKLGLKPVTSGGNIYVVQPYDEGVLNPLKEFEGIKTVGPIQLYIDLYNYPTRGREQAEHLREKVIGF